MGEAFQSLLFTFLNTLTASFSVIEFIQKQGDRWKYRWANKEVERRWWR
jgi:hypothetical protein